MHAQKGKKHVFLFQNLYKYLEKRRVRIMVRGQIISITARFWLNIVSENVI